MPQACPRRRESRIERGSQAAHKKAVDLPISRACTAISARFSTSPTRVFGRSVVVPLRGFRPLCEARRGAIRMVRRPLIFLSRRIAGQIAHIRAVLWQLIIDLDHVDAAIRIFAPNYNVEGIRQKRSRLPRTAHYRATSRARRLMPCGTHRGRCPPRNWPGTSWPNAGSDSSRTH